MKPTFALSMLLAVCGIISGCSGILSSEEPAKQVYLLQPIDLGASPATEENRPALSLNLNAVPGLDTDRILAVDSDARLYPYANARWPDFLPEVLVSVIRRSLMSTGRFATIAVNSIPEKSDWSLTLEVQQFYGVQRTRGSTSQVSAEFDGVLHCGDDTERLHFSSSRPVNEERLSAVVKSHQDALDDITRQLWDGIRTRCG